MEPTKNKPLRVAWFSYFPIEWLPDLPPELRNLPRMHPATWQRVLWEEFRSREDLELDILVVRSQFERSLTFKSGNTRFHCIKTPGGMRAASLYWVDTLLIKRALRKIQPDLVHAWGTEFAGATIAGRLHYRSLVTMQGILTWLGEHFALNRHQKLSRFLEPGSLRRARFVSCESRFAMEYLGDHYPHLKLLQIEHAPHPSFSRIVRTPNSRRTRIVCIGPFNEAKGADLVIKALDGIKESVELRWIGARNPILEEALRASTTPELWTEVQFLHNLTSAQVAEELASATLLIHATRADNSPNSVKEAVVAGVPVIATNTGGIPDYIIPGKNGFLFRNGQPDDCRRQLQAALAHPLFSRGAVDPETLGWAREYLSASTMSKKFAAAYQTVLTAE